MKQVKEKEIKLTHGQMWGEDEYMNGIRSNKKVVNMETHQAAKGLKAKHDRKAGKTGKKRNSEWKPISNRHRETDQIIPMPITLTESSHGF